MLMMIHGDHASRVVILMLRMSNAESRHVNANANPSLLPFHSSSSPLHLVPPPSRSAPLSAPFPEPFNPAQMPTDTARPKARSLSIERYIVTIDAKSFVQLLERRNEASSARLCPVQVTRQRGGGAGCVEGILMRMREGGGRRGEPSMSIKRVMDIVHTRFLFAGELGTLRLRHGWQSWRGRRGWGDGVGRRWSC